MMLDNSWVAEGVCGGDVLYFQLELHSLNKSQTLMVPPCVGLPPSSSSTSWSGGGNTQTWRPQLAAPLGGQSAPMRREIKYQSEKRLVKPLTVLREAVGGA